MLFDRYMFTFSPSLKPFKPFIIHLINLSYIPTRLTFFARSESLPEADIDDRRFLLIERNILIKVFQPIYFRKKTNKQSVNTTTITSYIS